ncbi:MAG: MoaD family protein [Anaerolineae bacterium]
MSTVVTVQYHNILRRAAGLGEETVRLPTGSSVRGAINQLSKTRPAMRSLLFTAEGDVASHVVVFLNRKLVTHDQFDSQLADGDELKLFPAVSGG